MTGRGNGSESEGMKRYEGIKGGNARLRERNKVVEGWRKLKGS